MVGVTENRRVIIAIEGASPQWQLVKSFVQATVRHNSGQTHTPKRVKRSTGKNGSSETTHALYREPHTATSPEKRVTYVGLVLLHPRGGVLLVAHDQVHCEVNRRVQTLASTMQTLSKV
jgi:hypothetical protein